MNKEFAVGDRVIGKHNSCLNWHGEITNIRGEGRQKKFTIIWHEHGEEEHIVGHLWPDDNNERLILPNPADFNEVEEEDDRNELPDEGNDNPEGEISFETVVDPINEDHEDAEPVAENNP